jgi:hypothetical protein
MGRVGLLLVLAALRALAVLAGQNPEDLEFRIKLVGDKSAFHAGESIQVEVSYSTESEKKYLGSWTSPSPGLEVVTPNLTPADGALDLRALRDYMGFAGSILSTSGYLSAQPMIQRLELGDWYRFQKPGHYAVRVFSNEVSRVKSAEEGDGLQHLRLESNALEFDILAADSTWSASELAEVEHTLDGERDPSERYRIFHRLILLDTPESVRKLVQLYLSKADATDYSLGNVDRGLRESSQIDLIIPLLEAALSDPSMDPREGMSDLLAGLQVRKELGVLPPRPENPGGQKEWMNRYEARTEVFQKYLAKANARLLKSMERRTGPQRALAIYQAWFTAERQNTAKPVAPDILSELRSEVLAIALELESGDRVQVLTSMWPRQPHAQLKPIVLSLIEGRRKEDSFMLDEGYKFWCEGWPQDCSNAILSEAIQPHTATSKNAVFLIGEAEHPELDEILRARLKNPEMLQDSWESQRTAAIILRGGSRKLRPAVDEFLDKYVAQPRYGCEIEGYLVGYLFRIAPAEGTKRFSEETQGEDKHCGTELFRTLHQVRYSDDLIPMAIKALDSPNLGSAGTAALFLAQHGPISAEAELWRRLNALREAWSERAAELRAAETRIDEKGIQGQAAMLEQELASALMNGVDWKLTPTAQAQLREGCLTNRCREIADGKMSFGF